MNQALTIARKEILDGVRDIRSVIAALFYALMGPIVIGLVAIATHASSKPGSGSSFLPGMMAIFILVSAFVGGMNVAMDTVAGERERQSLLPLLLNPVSRQMIALGKWLSVAFFAVAGLAIDVIGFAAVYGIAGLHALAISPKTFLLSGIALCSLALLAAAVQLLISTVSRTAKEAQTYLSLIVFGPMGVGMFLVFHPVARQGLCSVLPVIGQQLQIEALMTGAGVRLFQPIVLALLTSAVSAGILMLVANRLQRDEIIYGN